MNLEADPTHHSHSRWTWGLSAGVEKFFAKALAEIRHLTVSSEPKHDAQSKAEVKVLVFDS